MSASKLLKVSVKSKALKFRFINIVRKAWLNIKKQRKSYAIMTLFFLCMVIFGISYYFIRLEKIKETQKKDASQPEIPIIQKISERNVDVEENLFYGEYPQNNLDVYYNKESKNLPVIIMLHGGGWNTGDKQDDKVVDPKSSYYVSRGYVFVSVNYRLVNETIKFPENVNDVALAIKWVNNNISSFGGNGNIIYLMGHAAGAHLAALVVNDLHYLQSVNMDPLAIKGVVLLEGDYFDILQAYKRKDVKARILNYFGKEDLALMRSGSPAEFTAPGKRLPRFLILYASDNKDKSSYEQSNILYKKLIDSGYRASLKGVPKKSHDDMNADVGIPKDKLTVAINRLLENK